jgi:uncharacterized protein involved in outer membrane biogenesis
MKTVKKAIKRTGIALAVLILALLVLRIMLPGIIVSQTAKQIPKNLNAQGSLGSIALALLKGSTTLDDFTLGQPEGFGDEPLLHANHLHAAVSLRSLMGKTIKVRTVKLENATVNLVRNKDGIMNVQSLAKETTKETEEKTAEPKAILIEELRVNQLHVNFVDYSLGEELVSLTLTNITIAIDQLMLNGLSDQLADIAITAGILQPDRPAAQLGIFGKTGPVGSGIPDAALAVQLVGFELATLKGIAPTQPIETVLGGKGLDLNFQARAKSSIIDCAVAAKMNTGAAKNFPLRVDLTGENPKIDCDKNAAIFLAYQMVSGPLMAPLKNIGAAAGQVVDAVRDTAVDAVKGAGKTVGDAGKGLFGGLKKLAKGDVINAVGDVASTAAGAVEGVGGVVGGAAENIGEGAIKGVGTAAGMETLTDYRNQIDARKTAGFAAAREWVANQKLDDA